MKIEKRNSHLADQKKGNNQGTVGQGYVSALINTTHIEASDNFRGDRFGMSSCW